jgi:hypothetical protein
MRIGIDNTVLELCETGNVSLFSTIIREFQVRVKEDAFKRAISMVLSAKGGSLPLDLEVECVKIIDEGVLLVSKVRKKVMGRSIDVGVNIHVGIRMVDHKRVIFDVMSINVAGRIPVESLLASLFEKKIGEWTTRSGIERVVGNKRAVVVAPETLLQGFDLPIKVKPGGTWNVVCVPGLMDVRFTS